MPVWAHGVVWLLQRAVGAEEWVGGEEKCFWRRKQGISDAKMDAQTGEEVCPK